MAQGAEQILEIGATEAQPVNPIGGVGAAFDDGKVPGLVAGEVEGAEFEDSRLLAQQVVDIVGDRPDGVGQRLRRGEDRRPPARRGGRPLSSAGATSPVP